MNFHLMRFGFGAPDWESRGLPDHVQKRADLGRNRYCCPYQLLLWNPFEGDSFMGKRLSLVAKSSVLSHSRSLRMPQATNTLVLSNLTSSKLEDNDFIAALQNEMINQVPNTDIIQFIILKSFKRIILIFDNRDSSVLLYDYFRETHTDFTTGYSMYDYKLDLRNMHLQLPNNSRMFLISPPASPPPGFDYDQEEEEPNKLQIYTHDELKETFLKNHEALQELLDHTHNETKYSKQALKSLQHIEKEVVLNDSDHGPKIVLHPVMGHNDRLISRAIQSFKTSLPPKSVFDDLSDNEEDEWS